MAKQLYDYWFVQFDFPNEEGKPYKSSGGKMAWNDKLKREIPEGWEVLLVGDILDKVQNTPRLATNEYMTTGQYPIIDQTANIYYAGFTDREGAVSRQFPAVVFGDHSCAVKYVNFPFVRGADGTQIMLSKDDRIFIEYLYFATKNIPLREGYARHYSILKESYIIAPTIYIAKLYQKLAVKQFELITSNRKEIIELSKQRDELLPLLMNGQVSVNYHLANKNNVVNTLFRAKLLTLYKIGLNMSENIKLWDIIDSFVSGDWGNEEESPEAPCCVSCIRGADIVPICNSDFDNIPIRYISNRSFTTHCLQEGDIIVEKSGGSPTQSTGRVVYISKELLAAKHDIVCSNFCVAFRVKPEWNSLYIYYYLLNVYNAGVFFNFEGKTSGIKNLDIETAFKAIPIKTIAMETQISIATAISCLDKKIALNRALNDNLPTPGHSSVVVTTRLAA